MRILKFGLAAAAGVLLASTATGAGAAYAEWDYLSCIQDGHNECSALYLQYYDPEVNALYAPCYATFTANCRALYGLPPE